MTSRSKSSLSLAAADRSRLEAIVDRFEDAWEQGQRPAIEAFLAGDASSSAW